MLTIINLCLGLNLAEVSLFTACVMTLAVFNISKAVEENGVEITPPIDYTSGTITYVIIFIVGCGSLRPL